MKMASVEFQNKEFSVRDRHCQKLILTSCFRPLVASRKEHICLGLKLSKCPDFKGVELVRIYKNNPNARLYEKDIPH